MLRNSDFMKLRSRTVPDRRLLLEAVFWLACARIAILTIPFRWTTKLLAMKPLGETEPTQTFCDAASLAFAPRARWALRVAAARTPWKSNCLTKAVAGAGMLRLRQIASTLALGVAKTSSEWGDLRAHAWLSCGGIILTGGAHHKQYNVVATFTYSSK
jgi:Transglutaminase-like superfamily